MEPIIINIPTNNRVNIQLSKFIYSKKKNELMHYKTCKNTKCPREN